MSHDAEVSFEDLAQASFSINQSINQSINGICKAPLTELDSGAGQK